METSNQQNPPFGNSTARLTNTLNTIGYGAFNDWSEINRTDILSSYSKESLERVWKTFTTYVIQNYQSGKGTYIKNFGTFTFTNVEYSLEGTTNQYQRDVKLRRPVFIVCDDYVQGFKPGMYTKKSGLIYYTQKPNNSIGIIKVNPAEMAYGINISKEEFTTIFNNLIKEMGLQVKNGTFRNREMPGLGVFMVRANIFGMKFINEFNQSILKIPQKLIFTKKNIGLFMETDKTLGRRMCDLPNAEKAVKEIRPQTSVVTHVTNDGENWLKNNLGIDLKKDVIDPVDNDKSLFNNVENYNKDEKFSSRDFFKVKNAKMYGEKQKDKKLSEIGIPANILESIISCKGQIIKEMKVFDRRNNGIISRFEFVRALSKANIHHNLSMQTINEITNCYAKGIEFIDYFKVITCLLKDVKILLNKDIGRNGCESDGENCKNSTFNSRFKLGNSTMRGFGHTVNGSMTGRGMMGRTLSSSFNGYNNNKLNNSGNFNNSLNRYNSPSFSGELSATNATNPMNKSAMNFASSLKFIPNARGLTNSFKNGVDKIEGLKDENEQPTVPISNEDFESLDACVDEVENEIKAIKIIFKQILAPYTTYDITFLPPRDKNITYSDLNFILHKFQMTYTQEKLLKILKYLGVKNPNAFSLNFFNGLLQKCKLTTFEMSAKEINNLYAEMISLIKSKGNEKFIFDSANPETITLKKFIRLIKPLFNYSSQILTHFFHKLTDNNKSPTNSSNSTNILSKTAFLNSLGIHEKRNDLNVQFFDDFCTLVKKHAASRKMNVSNYFNHILDYNLLRGTNVLSQESFVLAFKQESYISEKYTDDELKFIFNTMDKNKDGVVDRNEFKMAVGKEQDALFKMQNIIKELGLTRDDLEFRLQLGKQDNREYIIATGLKGLSNYTLTEKKDWLTFYEYKEKMRKMDYTFTNEFIEGVFMDLTERPDLNGKLKVKVFLDKLDVYKKEHFRDTNKETFKLNFMHTIQDVVDFHSIKDALEAVDKDFTGKIPKAAFCKVINMFTNEYKDEDIMKFVRIANLNDPHTYEVLYTEFLKLIYYNEKLDLFLLCIDVLKKTFINQESGKQRDPKQCVKNIITTINGTSTYNITDYITTDKMFSYFKTKLDKKQAELLTKNIITKFDLDSDGKVSYDDLRGIIERYISTSFFKYENAQEGHLVNLYAEDQLTDTEFKAIIRQLKMVLKKKNITEIGLFKKLDEDNDGFISNYEFNKNIGKLLDLSSMYRDKIFNYLDYYHNGLIDQQTFLLRFKEFKSNEVIITNNNTIENVIIDTMSKWINKTAGSLSDTEVFSLIDKDHDGLISLADFRKFILEDMDISKDSFNDYKLERVMQCISLTKNRNIGIADIREFISKVIAGNISGYYVDLKETFKETTNLNLFKNKKNTEWINHAIEKFGMFISENFENIEDFYYKFAEKATENEPERKFKYTNFEEFYKKYYQCFYGFNLTRDELLAIFTSLDSQKKNYLTLEDFKNKLNLFDFYKKMHFDIKSFLKSNFPTNIDAFKYFIKPNINKVISSTSIPYRNYLTRKEFFDGLNYLFPKKYTTNTILEYFNKYFNTENNPILKNTATNLYSSNGNLFENPTSIQPQVTFSQFSFVYYDKIVSNDQYLMNRTFNANAAKISTSRSVQFPAFNKNKMTVGDQGDHPFEAADHPKLKTPFDTDPLEKLRRLIISSPMDYLTIIKNKIIKSGNGIVNHYEFKNLIKELKIAITNIEIDDIIKRVGRTRANEINLNDFYKYVTGADKNLVKSQNNSKETLGEIKQLLYKYYSNPKLAFEFCDDKKLNTMDFEQFKAIVAEMYNRENRTVPNFALLKNTYDLIDMRKDGIVDLNEWTNSFGIYPGKLDLFNNKLNRGEITMNSKNLKQIAALRKWETSDNVINIYKLIARNKKILTDKIKTFTLGKTDGYLIQEDNLINILKETFYSMNLTKTQWKMIVGIADKDNSGMVNFELFIKLVEHCSKKEQSHPKFR